MPSSQSFAHALDKSLLLNVASQVGIAVPKTVVPKNWEEVEHIASTFKYPGVLKWHDPAKVMSELKQNQLSLFKAEHVSNANEFICAAKRYLPLNAWPMMQEYCSGFGLGQFFFMHEGNAIRRFQHMRIAEWPPEGGFSSVCEAIPLQNFERLQELSIALLPKIGWDGVAMLEYRYDPEHDSAVLMELNGRFWGSYPLAVACNAGFGLLSYSVNTSGAVNVPGAMRDDLRCRMVSTEIKRLVRILFFPSKINDQNFKIEPIKELIRFVSDYFNPRVRYYVWSCNDPVPWFTDILNFIFRR